MLLYIARHGETVWNLEKKVQGISDVKLTDKGRKQAQKLAQRLQAEGIGEIYSSDLNRASETAFIISKRLGVKPIFSPLLREVSFGCWEGYTVEEIEKYYPGEFERWYSDPFFYPRYGESLNNVRDRIKNFLRFLMKGKINTNEKILIVSHALAGKVLILELAGIPVDCIRKIRLDNAGLSILEVSPERRRIISLNDICHLKKDAV